MTDLERALAVVPFGDFARLLAQARDEALEEAARVAQAGALVPPDGGSPTADEVALCDHIAAAIRALKDKSDR